MLSIIVKTLVRLIKNVKYVYNVVKYVFNVGQINGVAISELRASNKRESVPKDSNATEMQYSSIIIALHDYNIINANTRHIKHTDK